MSQEVTEVNLSEVAGIVTDEAPELEGLITYDQLVMNLLQQHHDTLEDYKKLKTALDNMHYTSTITKISLEDMQEKKDQLNKLAGAIEGLYLYKKHVDPTVTDKDFEFGE
tara:strand:+ start:1503 stop:1832 length:330 start_codon:yes stop_codon:yes gene_type:complete